MNVSLPIPNTSAEALTRSGSPPVCLVAIYILGVTSEKLHFCMWLKMVATGPQRRTSAHFRNRT